MSYDADATVTPDGSVTIPEGIRERLDIKPGDRLRFRLADSVQLSVTPVRSRESNVVPIGRRSIFDSLKEPEPLSLGRQLTQEDIYNAVGEAMTEKEKRIREQWRR